MADVYRVRTVNALPVAESLMRDAERLRRRRITVFRELRGRLEDIAKEEAPHGPEGSTYRDGVRERTTAAVSFRGAQAICTVHSYAVDDKTGYDYMRVTRFGHRKTVIRVREAKAMSVFIEGHRNPHAVIYRKAVAGAQVSEDWQTRAARRFGPAVAAAERRLGESVEQGMRVR